MVIFEYLIVNYHFSIFTHSSWMDSHTFKNLIVWGFDSDEWHQYLSIFFSDSFAVNNHLIHWNNIQIIDFKAATEHITCWLAHSPAFEHKRRLRSAYEGSNNMKLMLKPCTLTYLYLQVTGHTLKFCPFLLSSTQHTIPSLHLTTSRICWLEILLEIIVYMQTSLVV